jgi:16S rRNA (adenine1518-N6/adenine1519-N6)-dimethyltransferase
MSQISKSIIKKLLRQYRFRPNKRLGQNFLVNGKVLERIIQTANLSEKDTVLEIGSGLGTLTRKIAQKAKKVIAVEKDKRMVEMLKETLKDFKNIEIVHGDILKAFDSLGIKSGYKVVANIPYYLTSPLIRLLLESVNPPQEIILLIQKEVAQRICAKPPKMNLLAVSVQFYGHPQIISYIPKKSFWPRPKVDSTIIKIAPRPPVITSQAKQSRDKFFKLTKAGFSSPRKQLVNNLSEKLKLGRGEIKKALIQSGLSSQIRAQNLNLEDWKVLSSQLHSL